MVDRARYDVNNRPTLIAVSTANGVDPVVLEADPISHALITQVSAGVLVPYAYDYIGYTNTSSTVDTFVYKSGGAGGTTVATVTITYTDATKATMSTTVRT